MRMNSLYSKKWVTLLLISILLINQANALEDFTLKSSLQETSTCPGTTTLFVTEIVNVGDEESQYSVNLAGSASKWALSVPSGFVLKPGEKKNVYTYVTPKSASPAGSYQLDLSISTGDGLLKRISYKINVKDCYGVSVSGEEGKQICPCELAKYDFIVSNLGEFQETYSLQLSGSAANYVKLSEASISLNPGESKNVYAYLQNLCSLGQDEFTLTATGREVASYTSIVDVASCFDYSVTSEKDFVSICEHSTAAMPVTIRNDGSKTNEYALSIGGPAWANLEKTGLVLSSGQSGSVNLILNPDYKDIGQYTVDFKAISQLGEIEAIKPLTIEVKECTKVSLELQDEDDKICAGLEKRYQAIIKNTGEIENEYRIGMDGPEYSGVDKQVVKLKAGESASVNIELKPGEDANPGKQEIILEASTLDNAVSSRDSIYVEIVASSECFKPELSVEDNRIDIETESSGTIPITIKNSGVEDASYEISLSGDAASFSQLNPSSLDLNAGSSEIIYLYVAPTEEVKEGLHKATVTVRLKDSPVLDTENIDINVKASEESSSNNAVETTEETTVINENNTGLEPVTGEAVSNLGSSIFAYRWYIIVAFLISIGIILFIRYREKKVPVERWEKEIASGNYSLKEESNKKLFLWLAGGAGLAIVIVLMWMFSDIILPYAKYILTGIILLIVAVLLLKYKNKIVKFFEEDELSYKEQQKELSYKETSERTLQKEAVKIPEQKPVQQVQPVHVQHEVKLEKKEQPVQEVKHAEKEHFVKPAAETPAKKEAVKETKKVKPAEKEKKQEVKKAEKPGEKKSDEELYY